MTLKTHHLLSGAVALSILTTTSGLWAQSNPTPAASTSVGPSAAAKSPMDAFAQADANKDLKLSLTEAKEVPGLVAKFAATDTNKDGMVSEDELAKAVK